MRYVKKTIAYLIVIFTTMSFYPQSVSACSKTPNCYATGTYKVCGYVNSGVGAHLVTEPNGYSSYCTITIVSGNHTIKCTGCAADLGTTYATCSEYHSNSHCYDRINLCK